MSKWDSQAEISMDGMAKASQKCKPDYEGMIARTKKNQVLTVNFMQAMGDYIQNADHCISKSDLKELYGHLHFKCLELDKSITGLIEQQEQDK